LPGVIVLVPLLFYMCLFLSNSTLPEARASGWVAPLTASESILHVFALFDFRLVRWSVLPKLVFTWLSMTFLVVFASALDIVAVEMDLAGAELDIDKELETVGVSNFVSGLMGGLTGSYIFSQTIFTRRTGTTKRTIGLMLAVCEIGLFCAPFSLMRCVE
jgi:SulP family sulfate permease